MSVASKWYGLGILGQFKNTHPVDWINDTIKVALCTSSYTPNQDTHEYFSDVTNEVAGTGYTAGGVALASKTATYDGSTNKTKLDADDAAWAASTITARYAVIYKSTGTAGTSPLLGYVDFGQDVSSTAATFTIQWDADGLLRITAS